MTINIPPGVAFYRCVAAIRILRYSCWLTTTTFTKHKQAALDRLTASELLRTISFPVLLLRLIATDLDTFRCKV